jgi:ABC-type lipoprotein export system ATPase subunit
MAYGPAVLIDRQSLTVAPGERVAILGDSGQGKTTAVNLMLGYCRPTEGRVLVAGQPLDYTAANLRQHWNRMPLIAQEANSGKTLLPYLSVLRNVALVLRLRGLDRRQARQRAAALLERVSLVHRMGARPGMLSGGERQRAAVARALATESDVILADEPTAALDPGASHAVLDLLRATGRTLVIVTHEATLVTPFVDRVLVLHRARFHDITQIAKTNPSVFAGILTYADLLPSRNGPAEVNCSAAEARFGNAAALARR